MKVSHRSDTCLRETHAHSVTREQEAGVLGKGQDALLPPHFLMGRRSSLSLQPRHEEWRCPQRTREPHSQRRSLGGITLEAATPGRAAQGVLRARRAYPGHGAVRARGCADTGQGPAFLLRRSEDETKCRKGSNRGSAWAPTGIHSFHGKIQATEGSWAAAHSEVSCLHGREGLGCPGGRSWGGAAGTCPPQQRSTRRGDPTEEPLPLSLASRPVLEELEAG